MGKPVVKGTRLSVQLVIERLADGCSVEELVHLYPTLTKDDVLACLRYASQGVVHNFPLPSYLRSPRVSR